MSAQGCLMNIIADKGREIANLSELLNRLILSFLADEFEVEFKMVLENLLEDRAHAVRSPFRFRLVLENQREFRDGADPNLVQVVKLRMQGVESLLTGRETVVIEADRIQERIKHIPMGRLGNPSKLFLESSRQFLGQLLLIRSFHTENLCTLGHGLVEQETSIIRPPGRWVTVWRRNPPKAQASRVDASRWRNPARLPRRRSESPSLEGHP